MQVAVSTIVKIPTTLEMDGLLTEKDIADRHRIYGQCKACFEYSTFDITIGLFKCSFCGHNGHDKRATVSQRSFDDRLHNSKKRKK